MTSWFCMSIHLLSTVFQEIRQLQRENAGEPSAQHVQHLPFWDTVFIRLLVVLIVVDYQLIIAIVVAITEDPSHTILQQQGPMKDYSCKFNLRADFILSLYNTLYIYDIIYYIYDIIYYIYDIIYYIYDIIYYIYDIILYIWYNILYIWYNIIYIWFELIWYNIIHMI